jgi:arylsulfatase A-like enzyme
MLVLDTARGDRCSFNGYARPTTPRLEEFAKDAVTFLDAWSPAGWTGPAHATLFTGLRPDHHGVYDGEMAALDAECGVLMDRLRADGILDDTVVVVVGDHGDAIGEHHALGHGYDLHRAIRYVPLVVRFPGRFDGGRRESAVVRLEDVMPTILELCGLPLPVGLDGVTLARDLAGRVSYFSQPRIDGVRAFVEKSVPGSDGRPWAAGVECVYDGKWHYLAYSDGREELYDTPNDPAEQRNVAASQRATIEALLRRVPR